MTPLESVLKNVDPKNNIGKHSLSTKLNYLHLVYLISITRMKNMTVCCSGYVIKNILFTETIKFHYLLKYKYIFSVEKKNIILVEGIIKLNVLRKIIASFRFPFMIKQASASLTASKYISGGCALFSLNYR